MDDVVTPEQRGAAIVAVQAQLDSIQAALDAARATLAVLSMDAEAELEPIAEADPIAEPDPVATDDPTTCQHPVWLNVDAGGGNTQRLCDSCGLNLTQT